jgi:hypothetical protein
MTFQSLPKPPIAQRLDNQKRSHPLKSTSVNTLALAAAFAGLLGGTSVRLNAQPVQGSTATASANAGVLLVAQDTTKQDLPKHSCKGKNDCKGQGGGAHPGKNSCKGKGGCATDGSKPPSA